MMLNKTPQQVQEECGALEKAIRDLRNKQMSVNLLHQFQQKGATRPEFTWFVAGKDQSLS